MDGIQMESADASKSQERLPQPHPAISLTFGSSSHQESSFLISLTVVDGGRTCDIVLHRRAHSAIDALLDAVDQYFDRFQVRKISVQPFRHANTSKAGSQASMVS